MKNINLITTYTIIFAASAYAALATYAHLLIFLVNIENVK